MAERRGALLASAAMGAASALLAVAFIRTASSPPRGETTDDDSATRAPGPEDAGCSSPTTWCSCCFPKDAYNNASVAGPSYMSVAAEKGGEKLCNAVDHFDARPRKEYLSWDDYFMSVAFLSSLRSKDPNKQVGACIVGVDKVILGIGYNGFPRNCADASLPWAKKSRDGDKLQTKYPYVCHAEMNAIMNKNGASLRGSTIHVTMFPCNECSKLLIQAGVAEVVYFEDKRPTSTSSSSSSSSGGGSRNSGKVEKSSSKSGGLSTGLVETFPMTPTGSLVYMAPEGLGEPHVGGRFTDWWAVGVLAHELLVGRTPWSSMKDKEVIQDEILASRVAPPKGLSPRAGKLVCSLLCHDHTARLGSSSDREIQSAAFFRPVDWALTARQQAPPAFRLPCGGGGGETFSEWLVSESSKETVLNVLVSAKDRNGALEEYQKRCRRSEEESRKEGNPAKNKKKSLAAAMVAAVTRRGGGGGGSAAGRSNSKAAASSKTGGDDTQDKVWYFGLDVVASPPEYVPGASWFSTGAPAGK